MDENFIVDALERMLGSYSPSFKSGSADCVRHYLDHGEYELAYESLILSLIDGGVVVTVEDSLLLFEMGRSLGVDLEPLHGNDFWALATDYLSKPT